MSWTLLRTPDDWAKYQVDTAKGLAIGTDRVNWGSGPDSYPCLVGTILPPRPAGADPRVYSAFFYMADAEELFAAAGRTFTERGELGSPTQAQFNRWAAAGQMAVVKALVKTGLFAPKGGEKANEEAYEQLLLECIEFVDQYTSDKRDELRERLSQSQATVLDTLRPPG